MDKGSMVADSFRSEQECCAELALAWKHANEGKGNYYELCTTPVSKYLEDLKSKLEKAAEQAKLVSAVQQENMAYYHNLRSSDRVFKVGEKVIVLIPDSTSKLFARWQGPATIIGKRNPHSFLVKMPDNSTKHIHQNKLTHYVARSNAVNVIFEEEREFGQVETPPTATEESKFYEILNKLKVDNLNSCQLKTLKQLISNFKYIFIKPVQPARFRSFWEHSHLFQLGELFIVLKVFLLRNFDRIHPEDY
ncbi:retrovirus-related Pol polyprotein from transposon opus [Trichonephila clavata]|uniref:Retrovirus-related Pol polyprotein from transposon opus n=1 Tax=Trichonephila clavata TaxID=2740835 RepID=A0A8X6H6C4_TRICU|nr:retrovirus-related Pol polyprotein from transposon opus [Trichonephila clavata]